MFTWTFLFKMGFAINWRSLFAPFEFFHQINVSDQSLSLSTSCMKRHHAFTRTALYHYITLALENKHQHLNTRPIIYFANRAMQFFLDHVVTFEIFHQRCYLIRCPFFWSSLFSWLACVLSSRSFLILLLATFVFCLLCLFKLVVSLS